MDYSGITLGIMESNGNNSGITGAYAATVIFMHVCIHDELAVL